MILLIIFLFETQFSLHTGEKTSNGTHTHTRVHTRTHRYVTKAKGYDVNRMVAATLVFEGTHIQYIPI